jgi:hypothetical protein
VSAGLILAMALRGLILEPSERRLSPTLTWRELSELWRRRSLLLAAYAAGVAGLAALPVVAKLVQ